MAGRGLYGLVPFRPLGGEIRTQQIAVDASNGSAIGKYSPIEREADGNATASDADDPILGVAVGLLDSDKHPLSYLPASTAGYVVYVPFDACTFLCREDADGGKIADLSNTHDLVIGSVDTDLGTAKVEIDSSDTGGSVVNLLRYSEFWGDSSSDDYPIFEVQIVSGQDES